MDSGRTLIVSVGDYSFKQAEERGIYAFPSSYGRDHCDFVAFYRGKPVGAITHYAEVQEVIEEETDEKTGFLDQTDRALMFPERVDEPATIFKLGELIELDNPVSSDGENWIQSVMYRDFEDVKEADTISDLM
ncbi:hypothetical protein ACOJIV_07670 [Haloarcula sp. AONF1]